MNKDTRFSIRKLTVGVASIAVASFLTSGSIDAADLSILHSQDEKAAGYNPELPFEPFPPSITYTQPEAPWMEESLDTELPGDDVEEVTEPNDANYVNPEAPFAPTPVFTEAEAPFAGREVEVEDDVDDVTEPLPSNGVNPEAPFAPVEEEEVTEPRKPNYKNPEAPFAPVEEEEEVTEPRKPNYEDPEAPFAPVEDDEEDLEFEILPGYKVEEAIGADGKKYKRLVPIEEEETPETEEDEFEVLPGYKVEEAIGADGKPYKRLVPIEDEEEDSPTIEVKVVQETETIPYETERKENPDLYEDEEKVVQEGQEGKITKEYEVTYIKGEEVDRQEGRVVESVDPVKEIIEFGTNPVMTTGTEKHQVEEALPVVEEEDPELLEDETRTEPGSPKVTEITEEITYERGKEVSRKTIKEEVIDQGTAEIKYIGIKRVETITETETIPYETERKENPDLYEDEENVIQPGQEGKITKEYEVTYIKGEEVDRQEGRVVESVDPVKEIIEFGTKPVMTTGTEKHQVEEALPVVEEEDPELLEDETRTEPGSPKVTEITEEITYERGKEVSRKTIKEEVIDQGTAEIKYVGIKRVETVTETETIPYETERKENPDLYEDEEKVVQEGQEGKITKEYEVTYIKGEEVDRQEGRVVESVDPVKEIIEFGTKPVMTTGTEKHQVEEALPVVEKEDPELLEGEIRTESGSPKVTEITEEITYERGKEVSRKTTKEEVID
ncbi:G5 domain-containing protein, partial [Facklamia languida]